MIDEEKQINNKEKRSPRRVIGYLALLIAVVLALNLCFEGFQVLAGVGDYRYNSAATNGIPPDYINFDGVSPRLLDIFVDDWTPEDPFIFNSNRQMIQNASGAWEEKRLKPGTTNPYEAGNSGTYPWVQNQDGTYQEVHRRVLPGDVIRGRNVTLVNHHDMPLYVSAQLFFRVDGFEELAQKYKDSYNPLDALSGITHQDMLDNPGTAIPNVTDEEFYFDDYQKGEDDNPDGWKTRPNEETADMTPLPGKEYSRERGVNGPAERALEDFNNVGGVDPDRYNEFCDLLKEKAILRVFTLDASDNETDVYNGVCFPMHGTDETNWNILWNPPNHYNGEIMSQGVEVPKRVGSNPGVVRLGFELTLPGREMEGHGYSGDLSKLVSQNMTGKYDDGTGNMVNQYGKNLEDLYGDMIDNVNYYENEYMLNETTFWLKFGAKYESSPSSNPPATSGGSSDSDPSPSPRVTVASELPPIGDPSPSPTVISLTSEPGPDDKPSPGKVPALPVVTVNPNYPPGVDGPKGIPKTGDWGGSALRNIIIMGTMLLVALIALWRKKARNEEDDEYDEELDEDDFYDDEDEILDV